ncbi:NAD(P)H dehydrogenase [Pasteurellaceae bacterium 15-036681]|nr:NAD(P)H dehydrogenase [Pasteurellaceae bacterium 15-036681]
MNVLIVSGHPNLAQSNANSIIIEQIKTNLGNVGVRDLGALYPTHQIDVATEQAELVKADVIVFQFPMFWYSVPAVLKSYFDDVLTYGFAYGSTGDKLHCKKVIFSFTVGGVEESYNGEEMHKISALTAPFYDLAKFSGMQWQEPVYSCGMLYLEGLLPAEVLPVVQAKAKEHADRLIKQINA